jgi:hypothetical protein
MNAVTGFLKAFHTALSAGAFAIVGILSVAGQLDLTPVVALFVKDPAYLGAAMVGVAALFGILHSLSNSSARDMQVDETRERDRDRDGPGREARQKIDAGE